MKNGRAVGPLFGESEGEKVGLLPRKTAADFTTLQGGEVVMRRPFHFGRKFVAQPRGLAGGAPELEGMPGLVLDFDLQRTGGGGRVT